jgi:hypothetical protein
MAMESRRVRALFLAVGQQILQECGDDKNDDDPNRYAHTAPL